ncbi:uncharacterized protein AB9W97_005215 [Spinachia spinachia]
MASPEIGRVLRITVLEDSAECGVFVNVRCGEPLLLQFWRGKPPFRNDQVEQAAVRRRTATEVDFVLRALHRAAGRPNSHYWGPFLLSLCLDAHAFRFRLPPRGRLEGVTGGCGEIRMLR